MTTKDTEKQVEFAMENDSLAKHPAFAKVAKTTDIPVGKMKHFEVEGLSVLIANVKGKFYAVCDKCPHLNATLSEGILNDSIIICPRHFSSFDVTTGRAITGTRSGLQTYELKVDGSDLLVES